MSLSSEHLVLLGTPGRLQLWYMTALEDNGFLVASRLIPLKSLAVNLCLLFSTRFLQPCWLFATKRLMVLWSRPSIFRISRVPHFFFFVFFTFFFFFFFFYFSESVKSLFGPFCQKKRCCQIIMNVKSPEAPPSLITQCTSPDMLKSNKHSSLYDFELENMHNNDDMV